MKKLKYFKKLNILSVIILSLFSCIQDYDLEEDISKIEDNTSLGNIEAIDCSICDHKVTEWETNGDDINVQPGDVICLQAGNYDALKFVNIVGTETSPVIIRNCGGQAFIHSTTGYGMKFENCNNFKLLGDGGDMEYGIKVTNEKGFYITMEKFTTDFEIARIEIAGKNPNGIGSSSGFAGIGIKTSPYQACDLFTDPTRQAWIMRNVYVHDNYIHDTGGEGLYIGHGMYNGRLESQCSERTYSHSIKTIRVYDNIIENVGYDGIQIKNCDEDVEVYNNIIRGYGKKNEGAHNEGLFIGEGSTGKYFNNIIVNGTGNGIQFQGMGNNDIYNNLVINSGENGFYGAHGPSVYRFPDGYFNIMNNTIINSGHRGFVFYNNDGGVKRFVNNIVAVSGEELIKWGATFEHSNNYTTQDINSVKFVDPSQDNYRLQSSSPAVDQGMDVSSYGINVDFEGTARPKGSGFDIGAYESH